MYKPFNSVRNLEVSKRFVYLNKNAVSAKPLGVVIPGFEDLLYVMHLAVFPLTQFVLKVHSPFWLKVPQGCILITW